MRIEQFISGEAIDRLGDAVLLVGLDGRILDANRAALDCYGHSHAEMLTLSIRDIRASHDQDAIEQMRDAAEDGTLFEAEDRRSGVQAFPVEVRSTHVSVGGQTALLSIVRDITERKRTEQELRDSEARYGALIELSPSAILVDRSGKVTLANPACVRLFGASSPENLIGNPTLDLFDADSRPLVEERLRVGSETVPPIEVRIVRLDGTPVDVEAAASPLLERGTSSIEIVLHDITERRLLSASHYSRSLIEASLDPLVTISPDGRITDVNMATVEATGVPRDHLVGTDFADYFTEPDRARAGYERVLKDGFVRDYPLGLQNASGSVMDVEYNATVYHNELGEIQGVFAAARDVTEWKKAHEEAAQLAAIVASSEDAIFTKDLDDIVTSWNAGAEALYGYSAAEMIGESTARLMPPGSEDEPRQLTQRVLQGERISGFESLRKRKDGSLLELSLTFSPIRNDAGDITSISVIHRDITELKRAEEERAARLRFVEVMDEVNRAIQGTDDLDQLMSDVLNVVLSSLECDRVWLFYPCDPDSPSFRVPMEVAKPDHPGAGILNEDVPMPLDMAENLREALESAGPLTYLAGSDRPINRMTAEQFGVQSQMMVALYPKSGKPWAFGVHQCSYARAWTSEDMGLFQEIGRRLTDALSSLLSQRDLRESEARYRRIVDTATEGIWVLGSDTMTTSANARMAEMLGYPVEELIGRPLSAFMLEEDVPDHLMRMENGRQGLPEDYERRFRRKDGQTVWTLVSATPVFDNEHRFDGSFGMVTDITERKRAEHALRLSEEKFAAAFHASPDLLAITRLSDGEILEVNEGYERMLGYMQAESVGKTTAELSIWADPADRAEFVRRLTETGEVINFETTLRRRDGSTVSVIDSARSFDLRGEKNILSVAHDITERKETERKLRESEARFRRLAENAPDAIYRMSLPYGACEYMSPAASLIYGYSPQEFYATPGLVREVIHPDWRKYFEEQWAALIRGETPPTYEYQIIHRSGKVRWLNQRNVLVRDSAGSPTAIEGIVTDVTKRKQAEEELEFRNAILSTEQETSIDGILVVDENACILSYNRRFVELWHIPEGLVEGADDEPVLQFVADQLADQPAFLERVQHLYAHREETSRDELLLADGRTFDRYSAPMTGPGERYFGRVWYFRDVTERKRAEDVIRKLNRIYVVLSGINQAIVRLHEPQALFEEACRVAVEDGGFIATWIGLVDPADNRVRVVAQAGATEGYLDDIEIIVGHETLGRGPTGRSISERRHVFSQDIEHDPAMAPWRDNALRQGYRSSASFPLIVGDEAVGGFTMFADTPGFFDDEQLKLLDELAADISLAMEFADREERRRRAEEELLESEDRFRYFFDRSVVPMSMTPPAGAAHVNEAFCEMLGYTLEELDDKANWMPLTYPDDVADSQRQMDRLLSGERTSARYEKRFVHKDGGIVWTDVSSSLRRDAEGQPLYFMTAFVDITGRKNDEVELKHREAQLAELADEREHNLEQLARSFSSLIEVLCQVVEMRDPYTAGHQRRVSELAVRISEEMGMPARQVEEIRVAALIHDVGKISVPAEILTKPGKLSHSEFELIKDHSEAGYTIIESAHMEGPTAETVLQHHERCDGSGYPRGLSAEQLLPNAKVLMVADVVEAMTSHRPYRAALGMDVALEEIEGGAGRLYDSEVCKACVAVCRERGFVFSA